jgi:hypothetical protein
MFGALLDALISVNQACEQVMVTIHRYEPQIYALIVLAALIWFFASPKDDRDQI